MKIIKNGKERNREYIYIYIYINIRGGRPLLSLYIYLSLFLPLFLSRSLLSLTLSFSSSLSPSLGLATEIFPSRDSLLSMRMRRGGNFSLLLPLYPLLLLLFLLLSPSSDRFPSLPHSLSLSGNSSSLSTDPLSHDRNFFVARGFSLLPFFRFLYLFLSPLRSSLLSQFSLSPSLLQRKFFRREERREEENPPLSSPLLL